MTNKLDKDHQEWIQISLNHGLEKEVEEEDWSRCWNMMRISSITITKISMMI